MYTKCCLFRVGVEDEADREMQNFEAVRSVSVYK